MSTERALQRKRAELESVEHALGTTFQRIAVGSRRLEALSHMDRAAEAWLAACIPGTEHHAEAFAAHHSSCRAALKQEVESAMSEREKLARSVETLRHRSAAFQKH